MRKVTRLLLWLFISSASFGIHTSVPGIGSLTRLLGIVTIGVGVLTAVMEGRIRKPGVIFWFAAAFAMASFLSLFWSISYSSTAERAGTYIQLVAMIWLVREFAATREEQDWLRLAFCIGGLVFVFGLLRNYGAGLQLQANTGRYSASGISPNFVGFVMVTGFAMAWHLFLHHRGTVRLISSLYCLVAPVTVVLTGSRSAFLGLLVTASVIPLTLSPRSLSFWLKVAVLLLGAVVMVGFLVPLQSWDRLLTIAQEVEGGTMSGRTRIWATGAPLILERPLLGSGAGTFPVAVEHLFVPSLAAHNVLLALSVEQGVVGLFLFGGLLAACAWVIRGLPSPERKLWTASMVAWLIFAMAHDAHNDRVTWVMFALLAARESIRTARVQPSRSRVSTAHSALGEAVAVHASGLHPAHPLRSLR